MNTSTVPNFSSSLTKMSEMSKHFFLKKKRDIKSLLAHFESKLTYQFVVP